jgi:hypothetical protein
MADTYPFEWRENSEEDQARRAKCWIGHNSIGVRSVISSPMEVNMPAQFVERNVHTRIWNMKPRPDDVWIITYPKSGTTMGQELLWQMSRGCDVNSEESKAPLFARSPFIALGGLLRECSNQECEQCELSVPPKVPPFWIDPIAHAEGLTGPRIIKSHLPISMLPPTLLEVSKVIVLARNPRDACVSFFHHEKLFPHHGWDHSVPFEEYAKLYLDGKPSAYGDYFVHLKDTLKWSPNKNLKVVWYEDLIADFEAEVKGISEFTGFSVSEDQMKVLKDHMHIDNFRKNDAVNLKPPKGVVPDSVRDNFNFIRKGKVGDGKDLWNNCKDTLNEFNSWIEKNSKGPDGKTIAGMKYVS